MMCRFIGLWVLAGMLGGCSGKKSEDAATEEENILKRFSDKELHTNWQQALIDTAQILPGGPRKNDIPAIDYPEFISVAQAADVLQPMDFGILVQINEVTRFYPLRILNWHEIVNDVVGGVPVAVTFCPLCGSAITFSRVLGSDTLLFGVSGLLYESNLLMFDEETESLWLQASGVCVVGDYVGKRLALVNSMIVAFEEVLRHHPQAQVLSFQTGYDRNYMQNPYAAYDRTEELFFPVSRMFPLFSNKDMMYVVALDTLTVAFHWKTLVEQGRAEVNTSRGPLTVYVTDYMPRATLSQQKDPLPGYFSFWFSWYAVHGTHGLYWPQQQLR